MADRKLSVLTELTTPASDDEFLVLDTSESNSADKNKKIRYDTLLTEIPAGTVTAPSLGFTTDSDATGFFRSAEDEIAISTGDTLNSKFTTTGFQVGSGTATAQLHTAAFQRDAPIRRVLRGQQLRRVLPDGGSGPDLLPSRLLSAPRESLPRIIWSVST